MSNNQILKSNEIQTDKITFSAIKVNRFGGKLVYLNYNRGPLRVQTPKMSLPFGVSKWESAPGSNSFKYLMEFSFNDIEENEKMKQFYESIKAVEQKVKTQAESQSWFKKKLSKEVINEFFKSQLKVSVDEAGEETGKYPPRIKSKIIHNEAEGFKVDVYDSVKNTEGEYEKLVLDADNLEEIIPRGSKAIAILECTGVWFMDTQFGISWKVVQTKVFRSANKLSGFCLDESADEEEEKETKVADVTEALSEVSVTEEVENEVENEDDEVKVVDLPKKKSMKKK